MSVAPFPALGTFWALGGAPGAFVRADERLRERLERVAADTGVAGLADENAYARLLATVGFDGLMPATGRASAVGVEAAERRRAVEWGEAEPLGGRSPFAAHEPLPRRAPRDTEETLSKSGSPPCPSVSSAIETKSTVPLAAHEARPVAVRHSQHPALPRKVPAVRRPTDPTTIARVASLLVTPSTAERTPPPPAVLDLLTKTVQRAEHHLAERAHRSRDESAAEAPYAAKRTFDPFEPQESSRERGDAPSLGGLRGLATRFGAARPASTHRRVRAPLLVPPNDTLADWPAGALDPLGTLLDDVARRAGVDTAEDAP